MSVTCRKHKFYALRQIDCRFEFTRRNEAQHARRIVDVAAKSVLLRKIVRMLTCAVEHLYFCAVFHQFGNASLRRAACAHHPQGLIFVHKAVFVQRAHKSDAIGRYCLSACHGVDRRQRRTEQRGDTSLERYCHVTAVVTVNDIAKYVVAYVARQVDDVVTHANIVLRRELAHDLRRTTVTDVFADYRITRKSNTQRTPE